ncbi:MAG TPA: DUF1080 domain-containing protein [Polyangiaceae bacterium]|nr:DUF1080 domain-containing protein [Polyangiaceae bacterium]
MPIAGTAPAASGAAGLSSMGGSSSTSGSAGSAGSAGSGESAGSGGSAGGGGSAGAAGSSSGGAAGTAGSGGGSAGSDAGWVTLFNGKDLSGFTPSPGAAAFYTVDSASGEPAIHVYPTQPDQSDQPTATLRTNESYSSYVFHEEYKWGTKRFSDRKQTDRDNGLCFHICNDPNQVWPDSIEFQIGSQAWPGDWVVGNIFMLVNKTRAQWPFTNMNGQDAYSATGTKKSIGAPASYYKALATPPNLNKGGEGSSTSPATEWNILELTVHGSKDASYNVNGTVVNGLTDLECQVGGNWMPLDHGPLALQAEYAEVYFRNIKIKVLP